MNLTNCPICDKKLVTPRGEPDSPAVIIGEFPGRKEIERRIPFIGQAGRALRYELALMGLDMLNYRITNIWMHRPNEKCFEWHKEQVIKEAKGKKVVLLLGSDCAELFIGKKVMEIAGLPVKSALLESEFIVCSPNPAIVFQRNGKVGELRFALNTFKNLLSEQRSEEIIEELGF